MKRIFTFVFALCILVTGVFAQKKLIAFSSDATKNDKQQIFIMDTDGDNVQQVCFLNLDCYSPAFSPDGKKIIFSATNKLSDFLYMVNLDDTSTFRFPVFVDGGVDPHFSPDGKSLMYRSERELSNNIYIMDIESGEQFVVSDGSLATHGEYSPDGNKMIFSSSLDQNFDLALLDLTDTTENAQKTIIATKDAEIYGTISPDGKLVAFSSFDINYKGTLKVCDINGKNVKVISSSGSSYNGKFSPDGKYLAFITNKSGNYDLYICKTDGSNMKQISSESGNTLEFEWASDSKHIVYDNQSDDVSSVWYANIENGSKQNLTGDKANNKTPSIQK